MPLSGKAQNAKDNVVSVAQHLSQLNAAIANAIPALTDDNATDSLAKVQALKDALAPVSQAVLDASASYIEADTIEGT